MATLITASYGIIQAVRQFIDPSHNGSAALEIYLERCVGSYHHDDMLFDLYFGGYNSEEMDQRRSLYLACHSASLAFSSLESSCLSGQGTIQTTAKVLQVILTCWLVRPGKTKRSWFKHHLADQLIDVLRKGLNDSNDDRPVVVIFDDTPLGLELRQEFTSIVRYMKIGFESIEHFATIR